MEPEVINTSKTPPSILVVGKDTSESQPTMLNASSDSASDDDDNEIYNTVKDLCDKYGDNVIMNNVNKYKRRKRITSSNHNDGTNRRGKKRAVQLVTPVAIRRKVVEYCRRQASSQLDDDEKGTIRSAIAEFFPDLEYKNAYNRVTRWLKDDKNTGVYSSSTSEGNRCVVGGARGRRVETWRHEIYNDLCHEFYTSHEIHDKNEIKELARETIRNRALDIIREKWNDTIDEEQLLEREKKVKPSYFVTKFFSIFEDYISSRNANNTNEMNTIVTAVT